MGPESGCFNKTLCAFITRSIWKTPFRPIVLVPSQSNILIVLFVCVCVSVCHAVCVCVCHAGRMNMIPKARAERKQRVQCAGTVRWTDRHKHTQGKASDAHKELKATKCSREKV